MPDLPKSSWRLPIATGVVAFGLAIGVATGVDLTPHVEADFFFAPGDPQLRESRALEARYPAGELLIVRAQSSDITAESYETRVVDLHAALNAIPGVAAVYSVADQDSSSPLWGRVLTPAAAAATNLVVQLDVTDPVPLAQQLESVLAAHQRPDFRLLASGVPLIVELIRRGLTRDLIVFSTTALLLFGLITTLIYRDGRVVAGTLLSCFCACATVALVIGLTGIGVGLLTANIITIVFVLTLSHTVFITANWRRAAEKNGPASTNSQGGASAAAQAVIQTIRPSCWCMLTTLLGFLSLRMAAAEPLRELGTAGAAGTVIALVCAFGILPVWLGSAGPNPTAARPSEPSDASGILRKLRLRPVGDRVASRLWPQGLSQPSPGRLAIGGLIVAILGTGIFRLNTDPSLLSYFDPDGPIRSGLQVVDREGGSSPLLFAVADPAGQPLDNIGGYERMWEFQDSLEADPATGIVLSPAPILAHARTLPLAGFLPISFLLDLLERPELDGIAGGFVLEDRTEVLYSIRMIEDGRTEPRSAVVARLAAHAQTAGLSVQSTGGLYELQGRLGTLIAGSLKAGLGGLLILFLVIGVFVSRSGSTTLAMFACLLAVPAVVLGVFGHLGVAVDIITSPAAIVALALGVDSMIHLVNRERQLAGDPTRKGTSWHAARAQLTAPIVIACAIICVGFGIFALSDFPPTRRFGFAVILGTASAAATALIALPGIVAWRRSRD